MPPSAPIARRRKAGARRLTDLTLGEVSCVDVPANQGARHVMFKNLAAIVASNGSPAMHKAATDETFAALTSRCADLQRRLAERDEELAAMADRIAVLSLMAAPAIAEKAAAALAPPVSAQARQDSRMSGLAIFAKAHPDKGSRASWHGALIELGAHLAPDLPPTAQLQQALQDPRGQVFLAAKMDARG